MMHSLDSALIDGIQRAPILLLALNHSVEKDRRLGSFKVLHGGYPEAISRISAKRGTT